MTKEIPEYTYCEEARIKAMNDWRERYRATFRSDGMFCNWLKMTWNYKPVTPKYLKEYEQQKALIEEFELYKGVYDGIGSDHEYYGNEGKYWKIFCEEREKIYAKQREDWSRKLAKYRGSNVTVGHTPNRPKQPRRKKIYRG